MGITWIASYPKSGNTWVRFLLANCLAGPITESMQVEGAVPTLADGLDIDRLLGALSPLCIKTHYPWSARHLFAEKTERAIVIIRHPKDILLSNLDYHRMSLGGRRMTIARS